MKNPREPLLKLFDAEIDKISAVRRIIQGVKNNADADAQRAAQEASKILDIKLDDIR